MSTSPATIALIPLRGGSKSIPKKNIKTMAGQPLCAWVLRAASAATGIDAVYVSTDCSEISAVVRALDLGVRVIERPAALATDEASTEAVMLHFIEQVPCERLVTIQATSPQLSAADIDSALSHFERDKLDSLLSAVRCKRFFWDDNANALNYDPLHRPRRQEFSGTLMENGAFYITRSTTLEQYRCRLGGRIGIHEMTELSALEVDEPEDWERIESLLLSREHS
jgi:CMP-N-acetylneuraminic acid synthetase